MGRVMPGAAEPVSGVTETGDRFFDRLVDLARHLTDAAPAPHVDRDLSARLLLPRVREATYSAPPAHVRELDVPRRRGSVSTRIYRPRFLRADRPLLVWCHGGAFVGGDLDMPEAEVVGRELAVRADAVVISVAYRLCLDGVHFPSPNEDVLAVYEWALAHAASLGVDADRIAVGGVGAGACLAAAAAVRLRDEGRSTPASIVLVSPIVHAVLPTASDELAKKVARLSRALSPRPDVVEAMVENYAGARIAEIPHGALAGDIDDHFGLAPTLILNAEYDPLRASGEYFASQLRAADVEVMEETVTGVAHGYLNRAGHPQAARTLATIAKWIATVTRNADTPNPLQNRPAGWI
jgi:acetyl esterase